MNTDDIRSYVNELNIGPEADLAQAAKDLTKLLSEGDEPIRDAVDVLDELTVEINERLAQVEDEERAAGLERKLKVIEDASVELAKVKKTKSVLIVDDTAERVVDVSKTRPVALNEKEKAATESAAGVADVTGADNKSSLKDKLLHRDKKNKESGKSSDQEKLEKEASRMIEEKLKEQKRKEKEEQKKNAQEQKAADEKKQDDAAGNTPASKPDAPQAASGSSAGSMDPRLADALVKYHGRSYSKARENLQQLANDKSMSRKDQGIAKFFYGMMLAKGEGGPAEEEASEFWINEAAKNKNVDALMYVGGKYAQMTPESAEHNVEITVKALKNFERADKADEGKNKTAKLKYIEVCENKPIYRRAKNKACAYCDELAAEKTDAYEKKVFEDKKEAIKENYKTNKANKFSGGGVLVKNGWDLVVFIGAAMALLGDYLIFMTVLNKGDSLPKVLRLESLASSDSDSLLGALGGILKKWLGGLTEAFADTSVYFVVSGSLLLGFMLFILGRLLIGFEYYNSRGRLTEVLCEISAIATLFTIFGSILFYVFPGSSLLYFAGSIGVGVLMVIITAVVSLGTIMFRH